MEFFCPKCNYPLVGEPDTCPVCHNKLVYKVEILDGTGIPAMSEGIKTSSPIEPSMTARPPVKDKTKSKILAYNIVSILYNVACIAFLAFVLLFPLFVSPADGTEAYNNMLPQAIFGDFPASTAFGEMDYLVYLFVKMPLAIQEIRGAGGDAVSVIVFIAQWAMQALIVLFLVICVLLIVPSLIINIVNLVRGQPPGYIKRSGIDRFKDPLNPLVLFIFILIFFALDIYVMKLITFIPNIQFDNTLGSSLTMMSPLMFPAIFIPIIFAIVRACFRKGVNPKIKEIGY